MTGLRGPSSTEDSILATLEAAGCAVRGFSPRPCRVSARRARGTAPEALGFAWYLPSGILELTYCPGYMRCPS